MSKFKHVPKGEKLNDLIQLEHEIAELEDMYNNLKEKNKDVVDNRNTLASLQTQIGKRKSLMNKIEESLKGE